MGHILRGIITVKDNPYYTKEERKAAAVRIFAMAYGGPVRDNDPETDFYKKLVEDLDKKK